VVTAQLFEDFTFHVENMLTEDAIGKNFMIMPRTHEAKRERESEYSNFLTLVRENIARPH
jgi:hypothetical protein